MTSVKRGRLKTLRGRFTADPKGNVTLTLRAGKLRKRPVALTLTATGTGVRASRSFALRQAPPRGNVALCDGGSLEGGRSVVAVV